ncbi:hypothetical protein IJH74_02290 [Candidatus Saccharibacteria bacterium]|nr:hypothetical protein [Candidatus Saccharibacteria bacterium]
MRKTPKKRGQKLVKDLSDLSKKAGDSSREHIQENVIERFSHIKSVRLLILEWALLVTAIIMLAVTQAFWYSESYAVDSWGEGGTYTEATLGKINSLNPLFASTSSEKVLSRLMFSTLSSPDYSGHNGPDLASSIRTDDSGLNWTVELRKGLKWSDGEPIANEDVLYTVSVLQDANVNTNYSDSLTNVKVSESDGNLIFTLPTAYADFSSALDFPILPAHILKNVKPTLLLEDQFSVSPVTSGAVSYNATQTINSNGEKIVYLNPNKSYYKGAPLLDSFAVHAYMTTDDIINAVNAGSVTATADLLPTDSDKITSNLVHEKQTAISSGVYAFMNVTGNIFSNLKLRKAVQEGIDMRSLRAPLGEETALDYPLLKNQLDQEDLFPKLPDYNPDSARETIASASLENPVRLATVNTGYLPAIAENLKYQLELLGFKVELNTYDPGQDFLLTVIRPRDYDMLIYEVELGSDSDLFAYYHSSQATPTGLNLSNYNNALASDLLLAARSTMDNEIRDAKYHSFLELWVNEVPAIGIYQANMSYYVNKNVRSFSDDIRLVTPVDRFVDISFWATEKVVKNRTP